MREIKMLPCPFCGGQPYMQSDSDVDGCYWSKVRCRSCGATTRGKWASSSDSTCPQWYAEVREEWNARDVAEHNVKERDAEIEALRRELDRLRGEHVRVRRDRNAAQARAERLAEALRMMVENADDLVAYRHDEDDIGDRPCCQVASYEPHADHCPTHIARAALRDHDQEVGND